MCNVECVVGLLCDGDRQIQAHAARAEQVSAFSRWACMGRRVPPVVCVRVRLSSVAV